MSSKSGRHLQIVWRGVAAYFAVAAVALTVFTLLLMAGQDVLALVAFTVGWLVLLFITPRTFR